MLRIVVAGGGFAGVTTAQELAKRLGRDRRLAGQPGVSPDQAVEVVLLSRDNYFVFQPLLADIISGTIETTHVVVPLRRMLPHCTVEVGLIEAIDTANRTVRLQRQGGGEATIVSYDALVIALGSITDFRAVPGMAENAVGLRTWGRLLPAESRPRHARGGAHRGRS